MEKGLTSKNGPLVAGGIIGLIAVALARFGNPGNMGFCVACFTRDIAGALGFHSAGVVQYIRPEIPGFILGSFVSSIIFGEYTPRGGSSPAVRFGLGMFAMLGALVFLGCPWRAYLRVSGGDWNALYGVGGLIAGIIIGIIFLWRGFSLGASELTPKASGLVMPLISVVLIMFVFLAPKFGDNAPVFFSATGPGSEHAPVIMSMVAGLIVGWLAQRSRFCTVGAIRDFLMMGDSYLLKGIISFMIVAFAANYALGQFKPGFEGQPVAHTNELWNFMGMVLSGLAFTLAGGCPGRQLIMAGEGDSDAGIFVIGMLTGGAVAHNFSAASSGAGIGAYGMQVTIAGLIYCVCVGIFCREKVE